MNLSNSFGGGAAAAQPPRSGAMAPSPSWSGSSLTHWALRRVLKFALKRTLARFVAGGEVAMEALDVSWSQGHVAWNEGLLLDAEAVSRAMQGTGWCCVEGFVGKMMLYAPWAGSGAPDEQPAGASVTVEDLMLVLRPVGRAPPAPAANAKDDADDNNADADPESGTSAITTALRRLLGGVEFAVKRLEVRIEPPGDTPLVAAAALLRVRVASADEAAGAAAAAAALVGAAQPPGTQTTDAHWIELQGFTLALAPKPTDAPNAAPPVFRIEGRAPVPGRAKGVHAAAVLRRAPATAASDDDGNGDDDDGDDAHVDENQTAPSLAALTITSSLEVHADSAGIAALRRLVALATFPSRDAADTNADSSAAIPSSSSPPSLLTKIVEEARNTEDDECASSNFDESLSESLASLLAAPAWGSAGARSPPRASASATPGGSPTRQSDADASLASDASTAFFDARSLFSPGQSTQSQNPTLSPPHSPKTPQRYTATTPTRQAWHHAPATPPPRQAHTSMQPAWWVSASVHGELLVAGYTRRQSDEQTEDASARGAVRMRLLAPEVAACLSSSTKQPARKASQPLVWRDAAVRCVSVDIEELNAPQNRESVLARARSFDDGYLPRLRTATAALLPASPCPGVPRATAEDTNLEGGSVAIASEAIAAKSRAWPLVCVRASSSENAEAEKSPAVSVVARRSTPRLAPPSRSRGSGAPPRLADASVSVRVAPASVFAAADGAARALQVLAEISEACNDPPSGSDERVGQEPRRASSKTSLPEHDDEATADVVVTEWCVDLRCRALRAIAASPSAPDELLCVDVKGCAPHRDSAHAGIGARAAAGMLASDPLVRVSFDTPARGKAIGSLTPKSPSARVLFAGMQAYVCRLDPLKAPRPEGMARRGSADATAEGDAAADAPPGTCRQVLSLLSQYDEGRAPCEVYVGFATPNEDRAASSGGGSDGGGGTPSKATAAASVVATVLMEASRAMRNANAMESDENSPSHPSSSALGEAMERAALDCDVNVRISCSRVSLTSAPLPLPQPAWRRNATAKKDTGGSAAVRTDVHAAAGLVSSLVQSVIAVMPIDTSAPQLSLAFTGSATDVLVSVRGAAPGGEVPAPDATDLDLTLRDVRVRSASPLGTPCMSVSARRGDVVETGCSGGATARRAMVAPSGSDAGLVPPTPIGDARLVADEDGGEDHTSVAPGLAFASVMAGGDGASGRLNFLRLSRCCVGTGGSGGFSDFATRIASAFAPPNRKAAEQAAETTPAEPKEGDESALVVGLESCAVRWESDAGRHEVAVLSIDAATFATSGKQGLAGVPDTVLYEGARSDRWSLWVRGVAIHVLDDATSAEAHLRRIAGWEPNVRSLRSEGFFPFLKVAFVQVRQGPGVRMQDGAHELCARVGAISVKLKPEGVGTALRALGKFAKSRGGEGAPAKDEGQSGTRAGVADAKGASRAPSRSPLDDDVPSDSRSADGGAGVEEECEDAAAADLGASLLLARSAIEGEMLRQSMSLPPEPVHAGASLSDTAVASGGPGGLPIIEDYALPQQTPGGGAPAVGGGGAYASPPGLADDALPGPMDDGSAAASVWDPAPSARWFAPAPTFGATPTSSTAGDGRVMGGAAAVVEEYAALHATADSPRRAAASAAAPPHGDATPDWCPPSHSRVVVHLTSLKAKLSLAPSFASAAASSKSRAGAAKDGIDTVFRFTLHDAIAQVDRGDATASDARGVCLRAVLSVGDASAWKAVYKPAHKQYGTWRRCFGYHAPAPVAAAAAGGGGVEGGRADDDASREAARALIRPRETGEAMLLASLVNDTAVYARCIPLRLSLDRNAVTTLLSWRARMGAAREPDPQAEEAASLAASTGMVPRRLLLAETGPFVLRLDYLGAGSDVGGVLADAFPKPAGEDAAVGQNLLHLLTLVPVQGVMLALPAMRIKRRNAEIAVSASAARVELESGAWSFQLAALVSVLRMLLSKLVRYVASTQAHKFVAKSGLAKPVDGALRVGAAAGTGGVSGAAKALVVEALSAGALAAYGAEAVLRRAGEALLPGAVEARPPPADGAAPEAAEHADGGRLPAELSSSDDDACGVGGVAHATPRSTAEGLAHATRELGRGFEDAAHALVVGPARAYARGDAPTLLSAAALALRSAPTAAAAPAAAAAAAARSALLGARSELQTELQRYARYHWERGGSWR